MKPTEEVIASDIIKASIDDVWSLISGFNSLPDWHPLIKESKIENHIQETCIGAIRNFVLQDNSIVRETLLAFDSINKTFTYDIIESDMAVTDYTATIILEKITATNTTFIKWIFRYNCTLEDREHWRLFYPHEVAQPGFDKIKTLLEK